MPDKELCLREALAGSEEAVPGPSVFPSGEPGVSGDFWVSQEGCQGPSRPSGRNRGLPLTQGAPRDPRRDSRGERSPWLPLETRPDSPVPTLQGPCGSHDGESWAATASSQSPRRLPSPLFPLAKGSRPCRPHAYLIRPLSGPQISANLKLNEKQEVKKELVSWGVGTSSQLRKERHCLREWHQAPPPRHASMGSHRVGHD